MIGYAPGDGLTEMESRHWQIVDIGPVCNGLVPDQRDWRTLPAYRARMERAKLDIEKHRQHIEWCELARSGAVFGSDDVRDIVTLTEGVFDDGK